MLRLHQLYQAKATSCWCFRFEHHQDLSRAKLQTSLSDNQISSSQKNLNTLKLALGGLWVVLVWFGEWKLRRLKWAIEWWRPATSCCLFLFACFGVVVAAAASAAVIINQIASGRLASTWSLFALCCPIISVNSARVDPDLGWASCIAN